MKWLSRIADKSMPLSTYQNEAGPWHTCAFGEVNASVPNVVVTSLSGAPRDRKLSDLGIEFAGAVRRNQRGKALRVYLAIQQRVAKLAGVRV